MEEVDIDWHSWGSSSLTQQDSNEKEYISDDQEENHAVYIDWNRAWRRKHREQNKLKQSRRIMPRMEARKSRPRPNKWEILQTIYELEFFFKTKEARKISESISGKTTQMPKARRPVPHTPMAKETSAPAPSQRSTDSQIPAEAKGTSAPAPSPVDPLPVEAAPLPEGAAPLPENAAPLPEDAAPLPEEAAPPSREDLLRRLHATIEKARGGGQSNGQFEDRKKHMYFDP